MTCEARQDQILLLAAGLLDDPQQLEELRAHLATGCPTCNAALNEAIQMIEKIPATLDPVSPPPLAVKRLMQRVSQGDISNASSPVGIGWRIAAAAVIGIAVGAMLVHLQKRREHDRLLARIDQQEKSASASLAAVAERDQRLVEMQSLLSQQQLKLVSLTSSDQARGFARIFWDQKKNQWHVYVIDLKPPPPGRTYELWFIKKDAAQTKLMAGIFSTDANGFASITVPVPADIGELAVAAITEEPAGGSAQPTTPPFLVGAIQ